MANFYIKCYIAFMRKLLILVALMLCAGTIVFSQTDEDDDFSPLDAYYLGRAVAANILASYKPYNNQEAVQYLNSICQALVINSPHQAVYKGYYVMILDSDEFNAFATPGGHIFLTKKLVESATSEDMLAAVIAHELAHIMLRHGTNVIKKTKLETELGAVADWASKTAANQSEEAARAAVFRDDIGHIVNVLLNIGYSQTQEFEADLEAEVLLAGAGYDPSALIEVLKVLQKSKGSASGGLYSTHPAPEQRIANVERLKFRKNETLQYRAQRFKNMKF